MKLNAKETALILIGFQNDYFNKKGALHSVIEKTALKNNILKTTVSLIRELSSQNIKIFHTPILFSKNYTELPSPIGLMSKIKEIEAFKRNTFGGNTIPEISTFHKEVQELYGKTGFNAFNGTGLHSTLTDLKIKNVAFAGVVTSICIDSSARAAFEYKYNTFIISDCIGGRSAFEDKFYCDDVFPLFSTPVTADNLLKSLKVK